MARRSKREIEKEVRITAEYERLLAVFQKLDEQTRSTNDGLIRRAAFMRISLEDMESDIGKKGFVEKFQQSTNVPAYERERPVSRLYNSMNKNYQSIMKQLYDLLPKQDFIKQDDGFDEFVIGRDQDD